MGDEGDFLSEGFKMGKVKISRLQVKSIIVSRMEITLPSAPMVNTAIMSETLAIGRRGAM